jgi:hypothetical protein
MVFVNVASIAEVRQHGAKNYMIQQARATGARVARKCACTFLQILPLRESDKLQRIPKRKKMEAAMAQNFENHTKIVPVFHYFILPVLGINLVSAICRVVHFFSANTVISVLVAAALVLLALYGRMFALRVQDRVIRLEMQVRLQNLLPPDQRVRIPEFTVSQLVALRFASDAELPGLARKVLDEKFSDRKTIKKMIQNWQPDDLRA